MVRFGVMLNGRLRGLAWAVLLGGLVAAGGWATLQVRQAAAGRVPFILAGPVHLRPLPVPIAVAPPEPESTAAGTFLGMPDEPLLDRLRNAPIRRIRLNTGGSSLSLRLQFEDGSKAAFKPRQVFAHSIPRKEIAAYRLNRALGLNGVPPAAARTLDRSELVARLDPRDRPNLGKILAEARFEPDGRLAGEASYWIPVVRDADLEELESKVRWSSWLQADGPIQPWDRSHAAQISAMLVFDFLVNNADRLSGANTLGDDRLDRLFFMDNTMSFGPEPTGHANSLEALQRVERFSRRLIGAASALREDDIRGALAGEPNPPFPLLLDDEIAGVLARRDHLMGRVAELVAQHGADRVMCFE